MVIDCKLSPGGACGCDLIATFQSEMWRSKRPD